MYATCFFIFILAAAASFIQRVSGFGFGIFVMMFFPFFIPAFSECITLSGLLAGTTSLIIAVRNHKYIQWKITGIILAANVVTSFLAISYMSQFSNESLKKALGATLIVIACYFMFFKKKCNLHTGSKGVQGIIGAISGITGGVFAMPGPPIVLYCINAFHDKKEYIATLQALFCCSNIFYTLFRARAGFFTENTVYYWLIGLTGLFIGTQAGAKCFERISGSLLKKIVYGMMIVSGIVAML